MGTRTNNSAADFEKAPEGMHVARCFRVIDCGTHLDKKFGNKKRIGWVNFELPNALMQPNDKNHRAPFVVGKRYTLSHNEKALLRVDLESWYGRKFDTMELDKAGGFDLEKLIGRAAMINIVHNDKYVNIVSINPVPHGMDCPSPINEQFMFWMPEDFATPRFDKLSDKMKEYIRESFEAQNVDPAQVMHPPAAFDDDIPF